MLVSLALVVETTPSSVVVAASEVASVVIALVESELASVVDCVIASVVDASVLMSVDTSVVEVSLEVAVAVLSSVVNSVESVPVDSESSVVVKIITSSGSSDSPVPSEPIAIELLSTVLDGDSSELLLLAKGDAWSVEVLLSSALDDRFESLVASVTAIDDEDSLAELVESVTLRISWNLFSLLSFLLKN